MGNLYHFAREVRGQMLERKDTFQILTVFYAEDMLGLQVNYLKIIIYWSSKAYL